MTKWKNHLLFTSAVKAASLLKDNRKLFIYIMLADLIFILVNGFLSFNLIVRLQEYLFSAAGEIAERSADITQELIHKSIFEVLFSYPEISSLMYSIFGVLLLLAITVYIVFSVFQGYAWRTTLKMLGRNMSYYRFCRQFVIVTVLWLLLFYSQRIFVVLINIVNIVSEKVYHVSPSFMLDYLAIIFLAAIAYFALISYSLIGKYPVWKIIKKTFVLGVKKAAYLLPMYLVLLLLFWAINQILGVAGSQSQALFFIVGFLLVFPAFAFSRVYIALVVNKLAK